MWASSSCALADKFVEFGKKATVCNNHTVGTMAATVALLKIHTRY
jgi:hypothetical protein